MTSWDWHRKDGMPYVMGILNVTPDSFSDGGRYNDRERALAHALEMVEDGADIIDIGGESTRPGADPVSVEEEISRVVPVIEYVSKNLDVPISVDTMKAKTAAAALDAGADIVNDVRGLEDGGMLETVADHGSQVVIMHAFGSPHTFRTNHIGADYMERIRSYLERRVEVALEAGISGNDIILDPGIGFGTTDEQGADILRNPSYFSMGYPVLIGPSRKRFLSHIYPGVERDAATVLACTLTAEAGADIVRVHDVSRVVSELRKRRGV